MSVTEAIGRLKPAMQRAAVALACVLALVQAARAEAGEPSALAPGAMSQSNKPLTDDEIVVTGKTDAKPSEIREQARDITRDTPDKYHMPLAIFKQQVCPGIVGMPADMAEIMIDRIRYNAERIGIATASPGKCRPNILVLFVRNGQGVIRYMGRKRSYLFQTISLSDLKDMEADARPVHAWVNTEVRSRQGDVMNGSVLNVGQAQSHIFLAHRLDITSSVIMIDIAAIDGMRVVQIADYVTMRTFARTNPVEGGSAATTILSLFDAGNMARPRSLTDFDLAYLQAVYGGTDGLNAASKLASINSKLRAIQGKAEDDGADED